MDFEVEVFKNIHDQTINKTVYCTQGDKIPLGLDPPLILIFSKMNKNIHQDTTVS